MKLVKILIASSVITAAIISLPFAAASSGRDGGRSGTGTSFRGPLSNFGTPASGVVNWQKQLELTNEQVTKLNALHAADVNNLFTLQMAILTSARSLTAAELSGEEAKIKEASKVVAAAEEIMALARGAEYKKIKGILTDAQYKQFEQNITSTRNLRGGSSGDGERGGTGRGQSLDTSTQGFELRAGSGTGGTRTTSDFATPASRAVTMRTQLELTNEQVDKLNVLHAADANNLSTLQMAILTSTRSLTAAELSGEEAKIKEASKVVAAAKETMAFARGAEYKKIKSILKEQQIAQFQKVLTNPGRLR